MGRLGRWAVFISVARGDRRGEFVWGLVKLKFGHFRGHTFPAAALNRVIDPWFAVPVRAICLAVVGLLDEAPFVEMVAQVALCAAFAEIADAGPTRAVHSDADAAVVEVAPVLFRCCVAAYSCKDGGGGEICGWLNMLGSFVENSARLFGLCAGDWVKDENDNSSH